MANQVSCIRLLFAFPLLQRVNGIESPQPVRTVKIIPDIVPKGKGRSLNNESYCWCQHAFGEKIIFFNAEGVIIIYFGFN